LTQTQLVKALAAHGQVTNKVAKDSWKDWPPRQSAK